MVAPLHSSSLGAPAESAPAVLQVLPHLDAGGVPRGTIEVAEALIAAGGRALVASAGGAGVAELERIGAKHFALPLDSKNPLELVANANRLERLIARENVQIIHARSRAPAWSAEAAARRGGCAFVTTFHGTYGHASRLKRGYNAVMTRGQRVIAISHFIAEHIRSVYGIDEGRLRVIPRGVDPARFDPKAVSPARLIALSKRWRIPEGQRVVLMPARITRWKGQGVLVEALARLDRPNLLCLMVGDAQGRGRYRAELEALIAERGLAENVRILEPSGDMPAAYKLAEVVVSASTDPEAFGRVMVEAQAMGRPIVATDHGGARESVLAGETGWLVAPGDADALAAGIARALALDDITRAHMAERAVAHVCANFTTALMCRRTLDVYRELAGATAKRGAA